MLFCFPYDGVTGKYTLPVLTLVRVGGVVTVLVLLFVLVRAWRSSSSDRRPAPPQPISSAE
jgi:hypothetical protein